MVKIKTDTYSTVLLLYTLAHYTQTLVLPTRYWVHTHHLFDFNLGGAFLGIRKRALMGCMSQSAAIKAESTCIPHCFNSFSSFSLSLCHSYSSTTTVNPEISSLFHHITVSHVLVFFVQVFLSPPSPSFSLFLSLQILAQILCCFPL